MRRKDREVTKTEIINDIIKECDCCRLGFSDNGSVYIVPLSFGCEFDGEKRTFYFHGAAEGRKIELIKRGGKVGFEMDARHSINTADNACGHSAGFVSVIGEGDVSFINDEPEKIRALNIIMSHYTGKDEWEYNPAMLKSVCIFKLEVSALSCKEHK